MVTLAKGASSRGAKMPLQAKKATVMLDRSQVLLRHAAIASMAPQSENRLGTISPYNPSKSVGVSALAADCLFWPSPINFSPFSEDDIVRIEDTYGRSCAPPG
jgi:hypothetical protein